MDKVPSHLQKLESIKFGIFPSEITADDYAEVAFDLLKVSKGDEEALERLTDFIQKAYSQNKRNCNDLKHVKSELDNYIHWATCWTTQTTENQTQKES